MMPIYKAYAYSRDAIVVSDSILRDDDGNVFLRVPDGRKVRWIKVYPETVGVGTGCRDRNGQEIFSNDLVRSRTGETYPIEMIHGRWTIVGSALDMSKSYHFEIV